MGNDTPAVIGISGVILFAMMAIGGLMYTDYRKTVDNNNLTREMANKGYCQQAVVGSSNLAWVKCEAIK